MQVQRRVHVAMGRAGGCQYRVRGPFQVRGRRGPDAGRRGQGWTGVEHLKHLPCVDVHVTGN